MGRTPRRTPSGTAALAAWVAGIAGFALVAVGLAPARAAASRARPRASEVEVARPQTPAVGLSDYHRGFSFGIVPLANYTSDTGFGGGLGLALIDYADGREPFRNAIFIKGFLTTRWVQHHAAQWEAPHIGGTPLSVWVRTEFRRQIDANYFGIGNTAAWDGALTNPESERYVTQRYYQFLQMGPAVVARLSYPLVWKLSLEAGYTFEYLYVETYADSLLAAQRPLGADGGFTSMLHVGLVLDTRDRRITTRRGHWVEFSTRVSSRYLGGSTNFGGVTLSDRHYWNPVGDLVLAHRLLVDLLYGEVPFFHLSRFGDGALSDGLGGAWSLRGLAQHRYIGRIKIALNPEVRHHVLTWHWLGARFDLGAVAFFDVGRVWAAYEADGPTWNLHWAGGGGLRLVWNENFLARFEAGFSYEGPRIYVELWAPF